LSINVKLFGWLPSAPLGGTLCAGGIGNCVRGGVRPEGVLATGGGLSLHAARSKSNRQTRPHVKALRRARKTDILD
jgi:hypothetical protein